ncbi:MAG: hypothetical protein Q8O40_16485 [Chloroflexota bacterium]|nr:hypothetical protein [Chloroflexota bacterium]
MGTIYRRAYRLRKATPKWGMEVTLPPELVRQEVMKPGDTVDLLYDGFVLIVPQGMRVDEESLRRAVLQEAPLG